MAIEEKADERCQGHEHTALAERGEFYFENYDFGCEHELRHQVCLLREKVSELCV